MAILTRLQIYRALLSDPMHTNVHMVFRGGRNFSGASGEFRNEGDGQGDDDEDVSTAVWEAEGQFFSTYAPDSEWMRRRRLGPNNFWARIGTDEASIGDATSTKRRAWYVQFNDIKRLINNQFLGGSPDAVNPGPWLEDPTYLTPDMYTYMDMDGDGYSDDIIYSGPERAGNSQSVKSLIQDELQYLRSTVYAPNDRSAAKRQQYFDMAWANTIVRARMLGPYRPIAMQTEQTFLNLQRKHATRPAPKKFTLNNASGTYENRVKYVGTRFMVRLYAMHNALYGSQLRPFSNDLTIVRSDLTTVQQVISNVRAALDVIAADQRTWLNDEPARAALRSSVQENLTAEKLEDTGFTVQQLTSNDIASMSQNEAYKELFSTTFNQGLLTAVPMVQNLYLTTRYFPDLDDVFLGPKREVINLLIQTINGDTGFPDEPDLSRPASAAAIANANGMSPEDFGLNAGKFILKMLIQTPISILKGLTELIDPHVAITKVIKIATSQGFAAGAEALETAATELNKSLEEAEIVEEGTTTGKDLMTLILCLVDASFDGIDSGIASAWPEGMPMPGNFLPDVSMKGVDFTGTVSGMLMVPPSPLGLVYLLLELVKSAIDGIDVNVDGAAATNAEENAC